MGETLINTTAYYGASHKHFFGRSVIYSDHLEVTRANITEILEEAVKIHSGNCADIKYLERYSRGDQPSLHRTKQIRPEITAHVVENHFKEINDFWAGYMASGKTPVQYVCRDKDVDASVSDSLARMEIDLNQLADKKSVDYDRIATACQVGTSYVLALANPVENPDKDDAVVEVTHLDPKNTFVVYSNDAKHTPLLGVTYVTVKREKTDVTIFTCYSRNAVYRVESKGQTMTGDNVVAVSAHLNGDIPIVEFPLNRERIGAAEAVIELLDAINETACGRIEGVEQFIQSLLLFHNVDIDDENFKKLKEMGAMAYKDAEANMRGEVTFISQQLDQGQTQTLVDHMYNIVLRIVGMPSTSDGSTSDSSNNGAVIFKNGWATTEARARLIEASFARSERRLLKQLLKIYRTVPDSEGKKIDIAMRDIAISFPRKNYESLINCANLVLVLVQSKLFTPKRIIELSGLVTDNEEAWMEIQEFLTSDDAKTKVIREAVFGVGDAEADTAKPEGGDQSREEIKA